MYKLEKDKDGNFVLYCGDYKLCIFKGVESVSPAFLKEYCDLMIEFFEESGDSVEEVDLREMLDEWTREGLWNWREEVEVYKTCIDNDIELITDALNRGLVERMRQML